MKSLSIVIVALLLTLIAKGQENRKASEFMAYPVESFHTIDIDGVNLNISLSQGDSNLIKIPITDEIGEKPKYTVKDGVLLIGTQPPNGGGIFNIICKDLRTINVIGVVKIKGETKFTAPEFFYKIDGVATVEMELYVDKLETFILGAGKLSLSGEAKEHLVNVDGAGVLKAFDLITETTNIKCSGASVVKINVNKKLLGKISGVSKIHYKGSPNLDDLEISSVSKVKHVDADFMEELEKEIAIEIDKELSEINGETEDTVSFRIGSYKFLMFEVEEGQEGHSDCEEDNDEKDKGKKKKRNEIWTGFEMGVNGYLNNENKIEIPQDYEYLELDYGKSFNFNLNFYEQDFRIVDEYVKIVTGLGLEWSAYGFSNNTVLLNQKDSLGYIDTINDFTKSKLKIFRVNIPLLLEFNTSNDPKKAVHFAGGMIFGYNLGVKSKLVYEEDGDKRKDVDKSRYYTNPFRYGVTARVGYGKHFRLFATYDLSTLFQDNVGPELHPFTIGLTLIPL